MTNEQKLIEYIYEIYVNENKNIDKVYRVHEILFQDFDVSLAELRELFRSLNNKGYIEFICKDRTYYKYKVTELIDPSIKSEESITVLGEQNLENSSLLNITYGTSNDKYYTTGLKVFDYAMQLKKGNAVLLSSKYKDKIVDLLLIQGVVENALTGIKVLLTTWQDARTIDRMIIKYISGIDFQSKYTKDFVVDEDALQKSIMDFKKSSDDYKTVASNLVMVNECVCIADAMEKVPSLIKNNKIDLIVSSIIFIDAQITVGKAALYASYSENLGIAEKHFNKVSYVFFDSKKDVYIRNGFSVISGKQYGFEKRDDKILIVDIK